MHQAGARRRGIKADEPRELHSIGAVPCCVEDDSVSKSPSDQLDNWLTDQEVYPLPYKHYAYEPNTLNIMSAVRQGSKDVLSGPQAMSIAIGSEANSPEEVGRKI